MARIVLTTFGSGGDLNPFLALAIGLRARGHDVVFAVEEGFRPAVAAAGFPVRHMAGDAMGTMARYADEMFGRSNPLASLRVLIQRYIVPTLAGKVQDLRAACEGADLLVAAGQQVAASFVADLTGIPCASVVLSPIVLPSARTEPQPLPFTIPPALQQASNRFNWALGMAVIRQMMDPPINRLRRQYGLTPRRNWLYTGNLSTRYTALAASPAFAAPAPDWPPFVQMTGFLFWDRPDAWQEPAALSAFLAERDPVVAISSGSMTLEVAGPFTAFFKESLAAVRAVGARALVIGARPEDLPQPLPAGVLAVPFAPFSEVYPRCAAVLHHGGIGTVAQALRAGVPSLIAPWGADQFYHAAQVERIGAGRWLQRKEFTVERAVPLLDDVLRTPAYADNARAIAARIAAEDGVGALCDGLTALMR
jgi:UDP:flavonoid glycosyltransferase YjiC (YdhE family)